MLNRNDGDEAKRMMLFCVAAASVVLLLFLVVLYMHENKNSSSKHVVKEPVKTETTENDIEVGKSNLVSEDLDFWEMYDKDFSSNPEDGEEDELDEDDSSSSSRKNKRSNSSSSEKKKHDDDGEVDSEESMNGRKKNDDEDMDDGEHIKVKGQDGQTEWFEILEDIKKNNYKFKDYLTADGTHLKYNSPEVKSLLGMDISNYQGTVDFEKAKQSGIEFVMIKVAARGYESGQVNIDDKFVEYANGATTAGLPIGVYVTSSAITDVEAVEEANFAIAAAANYNVKYPIVLDFTRVSNDSSRTDKLTNIERTAIINKFCETVRSYQMTPAICASRDFLIANINLTDLKSCDVWLKDKAVIADYMRVQHVEDRDEDDESEDNDSNDSSSDSSSSSKSSSSKKSNSSSSKKSSSSSSSSSEREMDYEFVGTDYPYNFSMWQYTTDGTVNGVNGSVNLDLCFVNYAER